MDQDRRCGCAGSYMIHHEFEAQRQGNVKMTEALDNRLSVIPKAWGEAYSIGATVLPLEFIRRPLSLCPGKGWIACVCVVYFSLRTSAPSVNQ